MLLQPLKTSFFQKWLQFFILRGILAPKNMKKERILCTRPFSTPVQAKRSSGRSPVIFAVPGFLSAFQGAGSCWKTDTPGIGSVFGVGMRRLRFWFWSSTAGKVSLDTGGLSWKRHSDGKRKSKTDPRRLCRFRCRKAKSSKPKRSAFAVWNFLTAQTRIIKTAPDFQL